MRSAGAAATGTQAHLLWGGCGLAVSALLALVIWLPSATVDGSSALSWYDVPALVSSIVFVVAALILAGSVYCLGLGIRGEPGLVGDSRIGRIAVLVFTAAIAVNGLIRLLFTLWSPPVTFGFAVARSDIQLALGTVALAAMIVAVIVMIRRRMLSRVLRWGAVVVTAWTLLAKAVSYTPFAPAEPDTTFITILILAGDASYLGLLLQAVLGIGIALHGRGAALRRRAALLNKRWRAFSR